MFEVTPPPPPRPLVLPNQPLVTDPAPVINSNTAKDFIEAIRSGFITSQDIADRVGKLGQSQRAAEIQKNKEIVDPAFINARKEQALLAGETAAAQRPNVNEWEKYRMSRAEYESLNPLEREKLDAYERFDGDPLYYPNGKAATAEKVAIGGHYLKAKTKLEWATIGLTRAGQPIQTKKDGVTRMQWLNAHDEDITPGTPEGDANIKAYQKARREAQLMLMENPDAKKFKDVFAKKYFPTVKQGEAPQHTHGGTHVAPTALMEGGMVTPFSPAKTASTAKPVVQVAVAEPEPEPAPAATEEPGVVTDVVYEVPPAIKDVEGIAQSARASEPVKTWSEKVDVFRALDNLKQLYKIEDAKKGGGETALLDATLRGTLVNLVSPGAGVSGARAFGDLKMEQLTEHAEPLYNKIKHLPAELLRKEQFGPELRKQIFDAADAYVRAREAGARSALERVKVSAEPVQDMLKGSRWATHKFLTEDEEYLVQHGKTRPMASETQTPGTTETAPAAAPLVKPMPGITPVRPGIFRKS